MTIDLTDTLRYVNDPFVDAGVAVLEHRLQKSHQDFTASDLLIQAAELERLYEKKACSGYLMLHFPNSGWCNPNMSDSEKVEFRYTLLHSFDTIALDRSCVYCSRPAQHLADRTKIPLLTSRANMSSGPGGEPGLPVCSYCLYAIQFYPLATLKVQGRPLFWWTHDKQWLFYLTSEFAEKINQLLAGAPDSLPSLPWASTRLFETAWDVFQAQGRIGGELRLVDLVGCHVSNDNRKPDYEEIRIPKNLLTFWQEAQNYPIYHKIVDQHRISGKSKKPLGKRTSGPPPPSELVTRNSLYQDLGVAFRADADESALKRVARKYFLRLDDHQNAGDRYRLTRKFLENLTDMTKERLDAIERIAKTLSDSKKADDIVRRLFQPGNIVSALVEIQARLVASEEMAITSSDVHLALNIVSQDDSTAKDWWLARDLILLRMLECVRPATAKNIVDNATVLNDEVPA